MTSLKSNKRRNTRMMCQVPVEAKQGGVFDQTQTVDISPGGLGFLSRKSIPIARNVAVEIDLSPPKAPILVMGKVKWIQADRKKDTFRYGIEFGKVLSGSRKELKSA